MIFFCELRKSAKKKILNITMRAVSQSGRYTCTSLFIFHSRERYLGAVKGDSVPSGALIIQHLTRNFVLLTKGLDMLR